MMKKNGKQRNYRQKQKLKVVVVAVAEEEAVVKDAVHLLVEAADLVVEGDKL